MMITFNKLASLLRVLASSFQSTFSNSTTYQSAGNGCVSLLLGCLILFYTSSSQAQALTKQWDKRFGGTDKDNSKYAIQTKDGGYLLAGYSLSGIGGDKSEASRGSIDYWVVKIDSSGNKQWDKRFGGAGYDFLGSVIQCADGSYLLAGSSDSRVGGDKSQSGRGSSDYWVVKIDNQGIKQWDKRFGGAGYEQLESAITTPDGGYLLGGTSPSGIGGDKSEASQGNNDYWVVKIDNQGIKQWDKRFGGNNSEVLSTLVPTSDGGYLLAGSSASGMGGDITEASRGYYDYWVVKINSQGSKQWDKRFGGITNSGEYITDAIQASDGGYVLAGLTDSGMGGDITETSRGDKDFWVVKIDSQGIKQWDKRFGGTTVDQPESVIESAEGGYLIAGFSNSGISGDKTEDNVGLGESPDYWVVAIDVNGNKQWDQRFGGTGYDVITSAISTADGSYLFIGDSNSPISGHKTEDTRGLEDIWVVKANVDVPILSTIRIKAGGVAFTTTDGKLYQADAYYEGNTKTTPYQYYGIDNTLDDNLYRTDRVGNVDKGSFRYQIPVTNGQYQVRLHFSENYFREAGKRVFSVAAEGEAKLVNYDIYASVGRTTAVIKTYIVTVTDGALTLDFSATVNRPKINAIEVLSASAIARQQTDESLSNERALELTSAPTLVASPNPFWEQTMLSFQLTQSQATTLYLYNLQGQLLRTLFAGEVEAGTLQQVRLDRAGIPKGVYLVRLVTAGQVSHLKIVLNY